MTRQLTLNKLELEPLGKRRVEADFSAGHVSSDAGGVLLREVDLRLRLTDRLAECFTDYRNPDLIEHTVAQLLRQRIYGLALGYEDLNDHQRLCRDPLEPWIFSSPWSSRFEGLGLTSLSLSVETAASVAMTS